MTDKHYVVDADTTDEFLDLPRMRYAPDGKTLDELAADREAAGLPPLVLKKIPLPPLTDH